MDVRWRREQRRAMACRSFGFPRFVQIMNLGRWQRDAIEGKLVQAAVEISDREAVVQQGQTPVAELAWADDNRAAGNVPLMNFAAELAAVHEMHDFSGLVVVSDGDVVPAAG